MLALGEIYPTEFALSLGERSKLLLKHKKGVNHVEYVKRQMMMQDFQQLAMANDFDDCLIAFHGMELKKKHTEALEIIYKSTRPWALGFAATIVMKKLSSPLVSGLEAKALIESLKEHLTPISKNGGKDGKGGGGTLNIYTNMPQP